MVNCSAVCPVLVPLVSLGACGCDWRRPVGQLCHSSGRSGRRRAEAAAMCLTEDLFAAAAMRTVAKDLIVMKVAELKEELQARDEGKSDNKTWLQRRLHAAIVR